MTEEQFARLEAQIALLRTDVRDELRCVWWLACVNVAVSMGILCLAGSSSRGVQPCLTRQ